MYGGQGKTSTTTNLNIVTELPNTMGDLNDTGIAGNEAGGLDPPRLADTNKEATGEDRKRIRLQNKRRRQRLKATQQPKSLWTDHTGTVPYESTPMPREREEYRNSMCPTGRALRHPATDSLREWATLGCPTRTGRNWSKDEIWEAVERGPHRSATLPEAIKHFAAEIKEKIRTKQARVVAWDDLKDDPPPQLKVSPIAAILHKSKAFRSILDLSFRLRLKNGGVLAAVNDTTVKTAPQGAIDQLGECLTRIIHAFAEADDDAKIFMAKWDIKDGFWRMDCREGEEWNFGYGAGQGGPLGNIPNLRAGPSFSFFCTNSYIRRSRDVTRREPQHHTNRQNRQKHRHHGGRAALLSSDVELMDQRDPTCGRPVHGVGRGRG